MERPTWATVVGILAIIFGALGIIGGAQEIIMPYMLDMQKDLLLSMNELFQSQKNNPEINLNTGKSEADQFNPFELFAMFSEKLVLPGWFRTYAPLFGSISILVSGGYLLSGVLLLVLKPYAPTLFNITLGISILWGILTAVIYGLSDNVLLIMLIPASVTSIVIDIILLVVVYMGSKEAFKEC